MPEAEELVSTAAAALLLGVTRMQVRYLIRTGRLRAVREGNLWKVARRSVEALKEALRERAEAD
jgi:excisionase family DNA binding protein